MKPTTAEVLSRALVDTLFHSEKLNIQYQIDKLVSSNNELKGTNALGFILSNFTYWTSSASKLSRRVKGTPIPLHISLIKEANHFQGQINFIKAEERKIYQILLQLLIPAESENEIKDTLPDCLHPTLLQVFPSISTYINQPRIHEPGFTLLRDNPTDRQYKQFLKMLPTIHSYVAISMLT